ncbi:MAG: substrate-binding domain-containing protein [Lachnospiraceae bacterium]|nr:substrate-binding domain-containing protein [Lachnospiraceae bacterium]
MKKNGHHVIFPIVIGFTILIVLIIMMIFIYHDILRRSGVDAAENLTTYDKHFVLIVEDETSALWQDTYRVMQEYAGNRGAYVELKNHAHDYVLTDLMDQCIAANVDGIIVQDSAEETLSGKIDEAIAAGIPVVTVLNDAPASNRVSYIGINPYTMGQAYSEQILSLIDPEDEDIHVAVLLTDENVDHNEYQIFSQINNDLVTSEQIPGKITVEAVRMPADEVFASEEAIRSLMRYSTEIPDVIICFSTNHTDAVYQAVIDYNLAGQTQIIGYYLSDMTAEAIRSGNVATTMALDTNEIATYSVDALIDQLGEGRTNSYYGIDLHFWTAGDLPN